MKIGFDCRAAAWYRGTGIGNYSYKLLKNMLSFSQNSFDLYTPKDSLLDDIDINDVDINLYPISIGSEEGFWNKVNSSDYTTDVHTNVFHTPQNGIGIPLDKKCPTLITLHDIIPARMPETVSDTFNKMFHDNIQNILQRADGIITVSQFSKEDIMSEFSYPSEKIIVTHLASDECYRPLNKKLAKCMIRKKLHIEEDFILYIGGFTPRKNILGIIKAYEKNFSRLKDKYKLIIAGKFGQSYYLYKDFVQKHNLEAHVIFTGFIENAYLPFLYNAASLFMFPSFYEGFGLPPLEAMACGTPVIASNRTSIPEVLKDGAVYVDPYNLDDISKKMLSLLEDDSLRERMIEKGLKVNESYSWKKTAYKTISAYKKFCNRSKL